MTGNLSATSAVSMAWSDWMCPTPEPHQLLTLEQQYRAVAAYDLPQAQQVLCELTKLLLHQDLIVRGATKRIAELECRLAVLGGSIE